MTAAFEPAVRALAEALRARGWRLATAESCTGGLIAAACTAVAGSSDWFERGHVTYSNAAKTESLGVDAATLAAFGAVSEEVARAMAEGALRHSHADLAVAVTGIAGPGGATPGKPVGTVWLATAVAGGTVEAESLQLAGDRTSVREQTVAQALRRLAERARGRLMPILLAADVDAGDAAAWVAALAAALPEERLVRSVGEAAAGSIDIALVANPPAGALAGLSNLRLVQSLWAGVDRLLADAGVPADVPLARMVDPSMSACMAETALWAVLGLHRGGFAYAAQQRAARWQPVPLRRADEVGVAVLGLGEMGRATARRLVANGYRVVGWSRSEAHVDGVRTRFGDAALDSVLADADIVVDLLPLTPATRGRFDATAFARMRRGAGFVNLARGAHVVEADLLRALDAGQVGHAVLDVFQTEPLPAEHPFWAHPQVTVLPHAAAPTDPRSAAAVVAANVRALRRGEPLRHLVDRSRGY